MHRLHEEDRARAVCWDIVQLPAIAEDDETYGIETELGWYSFARWRGEALHPERQPLATLDKIHRTIGE